MADIPPFVHTPAESIASTAQKVQATFASHVTRPLEFRQKQLRRLYWALKDNSAAIEEACRRDLGKSTVETYITESGWCMNDIVYVYKNLKKWMREESAPDMALTNKFLRPRIRKDPLGAVLIIGTYNFPIQLSIGPLIGAIAAGCTAVLKPSESAPNAAAIVQKICESALDPSAYAIVQGAVPETTALLDQKWDKIFYTGGYNVAKIIAKKAAETLTPVTLELGGKNPAIVTKNADLHLAARRLLWGKTLNAGQVCVSQNYTLIDESVLPAFVEELKGAMKEFFPSGVQKSPDYGRVINERQFSRLKDMLAKTNGKILVGGTTDEKDHFFVEPTVIQVSSAEDPLLADESFGPLLTLLPYSSLPAAIQTANTLSGTPLAVYPFGNSTETEKILSETRSGGATVNDAFFHASIPNLAFGGVGESGQGAYRGRASFECFSHRRSVVATPGWMERLLASRYPPYTPSKLAMLKRVQDYRPPFGRERL